MSDTSSNTPATETVASAVTPYAAHAVVPRPVVPAWLLLGALVLAVTSVAGLAVAWHGLDRQRALEQELVRRQDASRGEASEAQAQSKQAQDLARDTAAKVALLDARLAEVALQRGQLEDLIQSMSRSRDENIVVDIEASVRVAVQQTVITGSAEPLVAALKQADDRLLRYKQPRFEGIRRAVARDLDRIKSLSVVDVSTLAIKLDEVVRLLDDLPLLASAERDAPEAAPAKRVVKAPAAAASVPVADGEMSQWLGQARQRWDDAVKLVWGETRSLIRVTRIDHPEGMLIAPDQSFFLRENLKLRLLNARLALLSRQFDTAQSDLRDVQETMGRYFDVHSRKVVAATELMRQVTGQARQITVPRPDDTLAALAAAGR
ncbi:uroporphyrinogen-III C-methyltransferase [Paucibacter sp. R3-3]|uniref:Uroporphyrinogen-III C-methyltransferase n=1 Tax=Roseateles agri TaxID=3098619 RepID=A0ABU5DN90_9BURK|nr:uroporphyrinogen-III C-methyltransferase [Paucibacter sp. R3-3]MDY0747196.1 uroporphyrinogen-III C-methyltransferase [Paucibacter sp. R3-3]